MSLEDRWTVAIVVTRQVTEELASVLAQQSVTVVSGLARGVDAIAHNAALKAGGHTLAVLGSGVDNSIRPNIASLPKK